MTNCPKNDISEFDDINTLDQYQEALAAGCSKEKALECCNENSRDNARTPVQWTGGRNAGFTEGTPWLSVNPNYTQINVEDQEKRPDSVLNHYRNLAALKKSPAYKETFTYGTFIPDYEDQDGVFAYHRKTDDQDILVAANYGTERCRLKLDGTSAKVLLSNTGSAEVRTREISETGMITLESCEAEVILLK